MYRQYLKIAIGNITHRKVRSWLTMIGIFIGVALFVSLISLGQGLQNAINEQFDMLGNDKIFISPSTRGAPGTSIDKLTENEKQIVIKEQGVEKFAALGYKLSRIEYKDGLIYASVSGTPVNEELKIFQEFGGFDVEEGRWIKKGDKHKVNVGWDYINVPNLIGEKPLKLGDKLLIEGEEFEIVGVFSKVGNSQDDRTIYMPIDVFFELYGLEEKEYDFFILKTKQGEIPGEIATNIKEDLRDYRNEDKGEESFDVETSENFRETFNNIFNIVNYFVAGLAFISLLVGGVGITNTMYTAVLERTKDIGIMKAIGARNSDILKLFLIEAGMIGFVGGLIGIVLGYGSSKLVEFVIKSGFGFEFLSVQFNWNLMIGVLGGAIIFGALAGSLPARQASTQKPVDALRYE